MSSLPFILMVLAVSFLQFPSGVCSSKFTIRNKCSYAVWPEILSCAVTPELSTIGFPLPPGESVSLSVPSSWSVRLWGRTLCTQDSSGKFSCLTGDFASSTMACSRGAPAPLATLPKLTLNVAGGLDFYEVSLVSCYNLPTMVAPRAGSGGNCSSTGCSADLNEDCPGELKIIDGSNEEVVVACKSACDAFGDAQCCCRGANGSPATCKPSTYREFFKNACPQAYSNAYDDGSSIFTCTGVDYVITFCPGLPTRLNFIAKAARPVLEDTAAETKSCSTSPTTATRDVVSILPRYPRRLLVKPPDVYFHAPRSTSNEKSWNLDEEDQRSPPAPIGKSDEEDPPRPPVPIGKSDKEDPPRPPAPIGRPPIHDSVSIGKSNEEEPPSLPTPIGKSDKEDPPRPPAPTGRPPVHDSAPIGKSNEEEPPSPPAPIGKSDKKDPPRPPTPIGRPPVHDSAQIGKSNEEEPPSPPAPIGKSDKEDPPRPPAPMGRPPIHDSAPIGESNEEDPPGPPVPIGKSDKEDPPRPPAPTGRPPLHDSAPIGKSDEEDPLSPSAPIGKPPRP